MTAGLVDVGAASQSGGNSADQTRVAFHKTADVIAETAVPLSPTVAREVPDLVQSRCVPGLGHDLRVQQAFGKLDTPHHGWIGQRRAILPAGQDGALVKAEA